MTDKQELEQILLKLGKFARYHQGYQQRKAGRTIDEIYAGVRIYHEAAIIQQVNALFKELGMHAVVLKRVPPSEPAEEQYVTNPT